MALYKVIHNNETIEIDPKHLVYRLRYVIITRCYNAKPKDYKYYQGRGIKVCDEWLQNPQSFFQWCFDNGWKEGMALDRIDSLKDYSPQNCQFITKSFNLQKMHKENNLKRENAGNARLTESDVIEIRKRLNYGVPCTRLGKDFGVSRSAIQAIKTGQNWKDKI